MNGSSPKSSPGRSRLDEAIDRLEEADDWEDSSVNVIVQHPPKSSKPPSAGLLHALSLLPPWGRVVVVLAILGALTGAGLLGKVLGAVTP